MNLSLIETSPFGQVGILWEPCLSSHRICAVVLSEPGLGAKLKIKKSFPDTITASCPGVDELAGEIAHFLSGLPVVPEHKHISFEACSPFRRSVLKETMKIPRGSTMTYKSLATAIGKPSAARAVGKALANNPFPIMIPCHRVVASDGTIGGFNGGGISMKLALLEMEQQA
ncbi:MAG: methylated-DNA--[protein]-cysteine S-methyltransferase [Victivallales bacterium]|nr:methylated-DNA--[protein]-cysteine S-methyltransferase [Victivallales bacterium]